MPKLWSKILNDFGLEKQDNTIINEEIEHISMWNKWKDKLEKQEENSSLKKLIDSLSSMSSSELAWVIHCFEIQQSKVSHTKKQWLIEHYWFTNSETLYFDEHMSEIEEKHISFWNLIEQKADRKNLETDLKNDQNFFIEL